jgi:hypothetical protein
VAAVAVSRSRDISFGGDDDDLDEQPLDDDELAASPEADEYVTGADETEAARVRAEVDEEQSRV